MSVVIIGAGGHAREVLDILRARGDDADGFIVEFGFGNSGTAIHNLPILGGLEWLDRRLDVTAVCAVGAPELRRRLVNEASRYGTTFSNAIHPSLNLTPWVEMGVGVVIAGGSTLTNEIVLGDHVHINVGCTVSHDSNLGDFATLSPGVHLAGGVTLEEGAFLGVGAVVLPRVTVGAWSVVGAGAVVTHDVAPAATVVGVPARVMKTREVGWHLE